MSIIYFNATDNELSDLYSNRIPDRLYDEFPLVQNSYILPVTSSPINKIQGIEEHTFSNSSVFKFQNNSISRVNYPVINNQYSGKLKPKNPEQICAFDLIQDTSVPVKLITGKFGTGKSLLCISGALSALEKGLFDKIVFVRNNIQVKDTDNLGALPGDEISKTLPYLMPFADHCGGVDGVYNLIDAGKLEVIPLGFLRGRDIKNSILYSMESENLSKEHIQLILGRVGENSQLWMDGDIKQRDRMSFTKSQGLETMIERLNGNPNFCHVNLLKSERSPIAALADMLD